MMFANFLEQVVAQAREPANAEAIIRRTWERYEANGGGSMLTAIDQVLQGAPYNTSLAAEFPEYARHNYFLNGDAYTRDAHVYINDTQNANDLFETIQIPQQNPQQAKEWQLFRSRLRGMAGLDYVGGQSQGACASTGSLYVGITVTCGLGALNSNANATVIVVVTPTVLISVTPPNLNAGIITATAIATANEPDPLTINNIVTRTATVNLSRKFSRVGPCWLTEYYDTPTPQGGNFRIY